MLTLDEIKWLGEEIALYKPLDEVQRNFHASPAPVRWLFGGNQCLGAEQLIYDPVAKSSKRISEITGPFHVYAFDGKRCVVAEAEKPFAKRVEPLYELELSNGESFVCSAGHVVLAPSGWAYVDELRPGSAVTRAPSPAADTSDDIANPITITSIRAVGSGTVWDFHVPRYRNYIVGGIVHHNSGKTNTNMMDLAQVALGVHPFRTVTRGLHWVCIESWEQVRDILWEEKLKKFIPPHHIFNINYGQDRVPRRILLKNGTRIEFKAFNQGRELFQGRAIDSCYCDEQCHHDFQGIFDEILARLMVRRGTLSWSMTPIVPQPLLEERIEKLPDTDQIFYADLNSNRISRGGYVPDERIDAMIDQWPEEVQATRIKGHFASFYGAVYKGFSRAVHVIKAFRIPEDWERYRGFDFGFVNPFVCLWLAKDGDGNWYVYREYYKAETGIGEHINAVKRLSSEERYVASWADPENAGDRAELRKAGIATEPARKDIAKGIELVQSKLKVKANGKPSLFFFDVCRHTTREMAAYRYPEGTNTRDPKDVPVKKNDHTCLVAGTLITTDQGEKPIEQIRVGDKVLTRQGYFPVVVTRMTDYEADVITAAFSNGTELVGTSTHPVYVEKKGWVPLGDLRYGSTIRHVASERSVLCLGTAKMGRQPVYNLTVSTAHEYYANGILVSNCDALRYVLYSTERPPKKGYVYAA